MDPLTFLLAITTGTATIAAMRTRSKWRIRAMDAGDLYVAAERECNRKQDAIDDLEHMAGIRSEQLAIAQRQITEAYEELARYHQLRDARRLADNAARKARHQRAKGVV